jgi:hypothetical protein
VIYVSQLQQLLYRHKTTKEIKPGTTSNYAHQITCEASVCNRGMISPVLPPLAAGGLLFFL